MKEKNSNEIQTIIGPSVNVKGDFKGEGDLIIEGGFTGTISTKNDIKIGSKANVKANIEAANAEISGSLTGDLVVHDKIVLSKTARLKGNISCQSLQIDEGAIFDGQCQMHSHDNLSENSEQVK